MPETAESSEETSRRALLGQGVLAAATLASGAALLEACVPSQQQTSGLSITVNGRSHHVQAASGTPLLYVLRNELQLRGPRFGCGLAECGACTVMVGNQAARSCVTRVDTVSGKSITTLEGLGTTAKPHRLQKAFIDEQAAQCAYCISGMILEAAVLLKSKPHPTLPEIKTALNGHLCRCGTHMRILRAVQRAAGTAS